jgi:hypothetical protein
MKGKLDMDGLWNAISERMIDFTSNTYDLYSATCNALSASNPNIWTK